MRHHLDDPPDRPRRPLTAQKRRRRALVSLLRSLVFFVAILVGYFVLPLDHPRDLGSIASLAVGLLVVTLLLGWQIFGVIGSPYPGARAIGALMVSVPLFLVVFATTYYVMSSTDPESFSEPLTRLDALYFTVTVFATVGFGDIVGVSQAARTVSMVQMVAGLVLVGLIARVMLSAVQESRTRQRIGLPVDETDDESRDR